MGTLLLMILDGWGWRDGGEGNAIALADIPNWNRILKSWPHTTLKTSGSAVGLPDGTMGNSEVGHLNIGAGRVVHQEYTRISSAIRDRTFFENKTLKDIFVKLNATGGALHLMGLASDIGVHSHLDHLYALVDFAGMEGINRIFIHCFTDGRDSPPDSGAGYIGKIIERTRGKAKVASISGRYYAMDRDKHWDRIAKAYSAIVDGVGKLSDSPLDAVETAYAAGETDEFITPTVITEGGRPVGKVDGRDAVIFFNFRADRARELTQAMTCKKFTPAIFATMTRYDEKFTLPIIFSPEHLTNLLGGVLAERGLKQLRIAETEKYAHVTFFFNGGSEKVFDGEERILIPSPRSVATYDKKPEMSAFEVTDELLRRLDSGKYDVIILNFANPDMVGHTGILPAAIKAVEAVDTCVGRIVEKVSSAGGVVLITGDHGNCEEMFDSRHRPQTAHTINLVPFVLVGHGLAKKRLRGGGILADIAPTMLDLLGIPKPTEMTGKTLILE